MTITEIATLSSPQPRANMGRSLAWWHGKLYVSSDNAMDQSPAGDYRPSGLVYEVELDESSGRLVPRIVRAIDNPAPTGRPRISNAALFTDRDGLGFALAACDLGVLAGIPYADSDDDWRDNSGRVIWVAGLFSAYQFPQVDMPEGAMLGYSLAASGRMVVAGAPGAQQALVYEFGESMSIPTINVLRPPWIDSYFGMHVEIAPENRIIVFSDTHAYVYRLDEGLWSWIGSWAKSAGHLIPVGIKGRNAWYSSQRLYAELGGPSAHVSFPTAMPPQFVPIVWLSDNRFAAGRADAMSARGLVSFFEISET